MDTRQVADDLVAMWQRGEHRERGEKYWAEDVVSREAMDGPMREIRGKKAVQEKSDWWEKTYEVNDASVSLSQATQAFAHKRTFRTAA